MQNTGESQPVTARIMTFRTLIAKKTLLNPFRFFTILCDTISLAKKSAKADYLILQSFSWFEFSLLLFTDSPETILKILRSLRGMSVKNIPRHEALVQNSLYNDLFPIFHPSTLEWQTCLPIRIPISVYMVTLLRNKIALYTLVLFVSGPCDVDSGFQA